MNNEIKAMGATGCVVAVILVFAAIVYPIYNVWNSGQSGLAELRKAEQNRGVRDRRSAIRVGGFGVFREAGAAREGAGGPA